jgi:hypothetical protein
MKKALAALLLAALLPACGGGKGADMNDETVQIMASRAPDANFLVLFLNRRTVFFNGDLPADRLHVTSSRLKLMGCRDPRLVRERAEEQEGTWSFGVKRIVYYSDWRCA